MCGGLCHRNVLSLPLCHRLQCVVRVVAAQFGVNFSEMKKGAGKARNANNNINYGRNNSIDNDSASATTASTKQHTLQRPQ